MKRVQRALLVVFLTSMTFHSASAQSPPLILPPDALVLTSESDVSDPNQLFINTCKAAGSYGANLFLGVHAGNCALLSDTLGELGRMQASFNTAVGYYAGASLSSGFNNTILGSLAGNTITTGSWQTLIGYRAGELMSTSIDNTAIGSVSMQNLTLGDFNTALGTKTLYFLNGGNSNIAIGWWAGTGFAEYLPGFDNEASLIDDRSIFIGPLASRHLSVDRQSALINSVAIGYNAKVGASNTMVLGGTADAALNVSIGSPVAPTRFWVPGEIGAGSYLDVNNYQYASLSTHQDAVMLSAKTSGLGFPSVDIILAPAGMGSVRVTTSLSMPNNTGVLGFEKSSGSTTIAMFMDSSDRLRIGLLDTTNFFMGADGSMLYLQGSSSKAVIGNLAGTGLRHVCADAEGALVACDN